MNERDTFRDNKGLRITLAVLFLVFPFIQNIVIEIYEAISKNTALLFEHEIVSMYNALCRIFDDMIYPSLGVVSVVAGISLLQKRSGFIKIALVGMVSNVVVTVYNAVMQILSFEVLPQLTGKNLDIDPEKSLDVVKSTPQVLYKYLIIGAIPFAISVAVIILTLLLRQKNAQNDEIKNKMPKSVVCMMLFGVVFFLLQLSEFISAPLRIGAIDIANEYSIMSVTKSTIFVLEIPPLLVLGFAIIGRKWKNVMAYLPAIGVIMLNKLITVAFSFFTVGSFCVKLGTMDVASPYVACAVFVSAVSVIAYYCWCVSAAKGCISIWLQSILVVVCPVITLGVFFLTARVLKLGLYSEITATLIVSVLILVFSLVTGLSRKSLTKECD